MTSEWTRRIGKIDNPGISLSYSQRKYAQMMSEIRACFIYWIRGGCT